MTADRPAPQDTGPTKIKCQMCGGDGWYVGHDDECYETGDCNCSGVQVRCETCGGTGEVDNGN